MSEPKDAKYFGARIGDRCWYNNEQYIINNIELKVLSFYVYIGPHTGDNTINICNGQGITFEPPKSNEQNDFRLWLKSTMQEIKDPSGDYVLLPCVDMIATNGEIVQCIEGSAKHKDLVSSGAVFLHGHVYTCAKENIK